MRDVTLSYSTEADIEFVRASVHAIGRCALKVDSTVDKCISYRVRSVMWFKRLSL